MKLDRFSRAPRLAFLLVSLVALSLNAAPAKETIRLALNWKPEPQFGGFYAARLGEIDKKHGFEFDIVPGGAGTPVVQMVAAGKFDFGIVSGDELVVSRVRGSDVVALFATYQTNPQAVMAREERGFESLADVFKSEGTIAMQKGLPYALFLARKYAQGMRATIVPYVGGISNFMADSKHSQQCFVTSEPLLARKQGRKVRTFLVAESGFNPYTTVLITRRSVLEKNPQLIKDMVAAVRDGWRQYLDKPDETDKHMHKLNPSIDLETFRQSGIAQKPLIETADTKKLGLGSMTAERWKELSEQLLSMKVIDKTPASATLFVNN